jgi:signal transduction histidine kinase
MRTPKVARVFVREARWPVHHRSGHLDRTTPASLTARVLSAQEAERRRVSREMHDDLAQRLALLQFEIAGMKQRFASQPQISSDLDSLCGSVALLADDLHRICEQLHPAVLDRLGLVRGIESLCGDQAKMSGMKVVFVHGSIPEHLPPEVALCLYRVVQEALQNAAKHSGAREVFVTLRREGDGIRAIVRDTGRGLEKKSGGRQGLGLTFIAERVNLLHGRSTISTAQRKGARISVWVPYRCTGK